jgi:type IX secretion system PorP/SprF family membrane protein
MNIKSNIHILEKIFLIIVFVFTFYTTQGQQTPFSPISYWVFNPYLYNPAIVGSKDFLSIGINLSFKGKSNSQLISGNTRISKTKSGYFSSPDITEFKNLGIGGSVFRDIDGLSKNIGLSVSGSYQIPFNTRKLSFLSFGASVKTAYSTISNDSAGQDNTLKKTFYPNLDLGVYYYGTSFFTGVSLVNILGSPWIPDPLGIYKVPVSREYFFTAGYKILLSKPLSIVLEPSVLISATDSTFGKITDNINPILKLYLEDFCFGTSFNSNGNIAFFSQFRYPRFYVGVYYELSKKTAYYKKTPLVEFTVGINIQPDKSRFSVHSKW